MNSCAAIPTKPRPRAPDECLSWCNVIRRGWDWLGLTPANASHISGLNEVPDLAVRDAVPVALGLEFQRWSSRPSPSAFSNRVAPDRGIVRTPVDQEAVIRARVSWSGYVRSVGGRPSQRRSARSTTANCMALSTPRANQLGMRNGDQVLRVEHTGSKKRDRYGSLESRLPWTGGVRKQGDERPTIPVWTRCS
jgi:hypothetical protein